MTTQPADARPKRLDLLRSGVAWSVLGVLTAALLLLPAALFWMGIAVAVGTGDPTWNDSEQHWGTAVGAGVSVIIAALVALDVVRLRRRLGHGIAGWQLAAWWLPTALLNGFFVAAFLN